MIDLIKQSLTAQFEAALSMMRQCIDACPDEHWEGKIANGSLRWAAYHVLFFTDLYMTRSEGAFELREAHREGGDEREPVACRGLEREETLKYLAVVCEKVVETMAGETVESLAAGSGFSWLKFSRLEAHLYNLRHVQHHTGQFSAYVRRVAPAADEHQRLRWVHSGWK